MLPGFRNCKCRNAHNAFHYGRRLGFEVLEDRRVLATMADIIFLVDASASQDQTSPQVIPWLKATVTGDLNNNEILDAGDVPNLSQRLDSQGISDVRYGLVAYGQDGFAHSQIVGNGPGSAFERLFSDGTDHVADLYSALTHLRLTGGEEDGWDAIEHAIAEYDFRPGAVAEFVLVQGDEGRNGSGGNSNTTLTHPGVLAALKSKNVILNSMVVSPGGTNGDPLFRLSHYENNAGDFTNMRILGVEASKSADGQHDYHAFNTVTQQIATSAPATRADTLQISYHGSNTGASGMVGNGKSILIGTNISDGIGPTTFGYRAKAVPYLDVDMSGASSISAGLAIPSYSFNFFGTTYSNSNGGVRVNQDGTVTFGVANSSGANVDLSYDSFEGRPSMPMIAALWQELTDTISHKSVDVDIDGLADRVIQWGARLQVVLLSNGKIQINY